MNWFKKRRDELAKESGSKFTQRMVATALNITDGAVGQWETDVSTPPISRASDLAKAYRVNEAKIISEIAKQAKRVRESRKEPAPV